MTGLIGSLSPSEGTSFKTNKQTYFYITTTRFIVECVKKIKQKE